jgi:hypothetical protein
MKQTDISKSDQQKIFQMQCEICKALAHPVRMAIVNCLRDKEMAAADLIADLGISKVNLSKTSRCSSAEESWSRGAMAGSSCIASPIRYSGGVFHHEFRYLSPAEAGRKAGLGDELDQVVLTLAFLTKTTSLVQPCISHSFD